MIFNKNLKGNEEVKAMIGFIYKSINFDNLKPYIQLVTSELEDIITKEVYDYAEEWYLSDDYDNPAHNTDADKLNNELVNKIQQVIALGAYLYYVNSNDVEHTNSGRKITITETSKQAFAWQIKKDNENIDDLYNRFTDLLLKFMEANPESDFGLLWMDSDAFKTTKQLLIPNADSFEAYFKINRSRRLYLALAPGMLRIQNQRFAAILKQNLLDKFIKYQQKIDNTTLTDREMTILNACKLPLALLSIADGIKLLSNKLLPDRMINLYTEVTDGASEKNLTTKDRLIQAATFAKTADAELRTLQSLISKYYAELNGTLVEEVSLRNTDYEAKVVSL